LFSFFQDSQSILQDEARVESGWDDGFEGLRHEAVASQSVSQVSAPELTTIERELEVWNQVIQAPGKANEIDIDILSFWKKTAASLPNLAWLARRILSIPASSTSSERAFSTGGKVISSSRTLLNTDKAETLIWIMENFEALDPLVPKYILRNSDFKKLDQARAKEARKESRDKDKDVADKDPSSSSDASDSETEGYKSDDIMSIHDSDDDAQDE
jgi:hypothetical protein